MASAKQFAKNLRSARTSAGLSQEELAAKAGLHRTELSLLERSKRDPRLSTVVKLSRALKVPLDELVRGVR